MNANNLEMDVRDLTALVWRLRSQINWTDPSFTLEKAFICAVFSDLIYHDLPQFEIEGSRAAVIPSMAHSKLYRSGKVVDVTALIRAGDFGDSFVIRTDLAIVLGVRLIDVVIVAIRGTQNFFDGLVDIKATAKKVRVHLGKTQIPMHFHSGFLLAASGMAGQLNHELKKYPNLPVYFTGHSLGGALSAVFNSLAGTTSSLRYSSNFSEIKSTSCYTFAMPKYGSRSAVSVLPTPFHVYKPRDIVPHLPPRWTRYAICQEEFCLSTEGLRATRSRPFLAASYFPPFKAYKKFKIVHAMESYRALLAGLVFKT